MEYRVAVRAVRQSGWWTPSGAARLARDVRSPHAVPSDDASLRAAIDWLARAQDATTDGGIAGRYSLGSGWSSSYPETTGYAIPTLLHAAEILGDTSHVDRAHRCVEFLLSVQLPCGAFPGLEIAQNRTAPSAFNTAQIIHGLQRWHGETKGPRVLDALTRAAHWLCDVQDDDGAWRRFFYRELACTYSAHAACWLAELGAYVGEPRFRTCAERNLHWVLAHRDPHTGWIDRCGFSAEDHERRRAHTHTIAYTFAGVLRLADSLSSGEARDAVSYAAERLLERLGRSRTLSGILNHRWQPAADYVCVTGCAQIAVLWLELARRSGDLRYVNAAFAAIDAVKRTQSLVSRSDGIRGGIPGSSPIWGAYIPFAFPNWAAKFFVDALCAKRECLQGLASALPRDPILARDRAVAVSATRSTAAGTDAIVVYTTRISPAFARLVAGWLTRGFAPSLVVIEHGRAGVARRLASAAKQRDDDSARLCRRYGWRFLRVSSVNTRTALDAVLDLKPLLAVNAGAGILRQPILDAPRAGTLGAHMGLLPYYRGMNVAEWAAIHGDAVGCSVFWLDRGIDTGPIVASRRIDTIACRSIDELRERVDAAQWALLDETLRTIVDAGLLPAAEPQRPEDGRQHFRMHADLRAVLERRLDSASRGVGTAAGR